MGKRQAKVEYWETPSDGRFRWHKRAANGQITNGPLQGFASSQGCRRSAKRETGITDPDRIVKVAPPRGAFHHR